MFDDIDCEEDPGRQANRLIKATLGTDQTVAEWQSEIGPLRESSLV